MERITVNKRILAQLLLIASYIFRITAIECKHGDYDLSPLAGEWISKSEDGQYTYKINLCSPLVANGATDHPCHSNTSVCRIDNNGTGLSMGNYTHDVVGELTGAANDNGEMWIVLAGDQCPESEFSNLTTTINLKCGPTLGSPKFLNHMFCVSYFEWESHVYCKGDKPDKEVKCYLYDDEKRYDLSPLAKRYGGYLVSSYSGTDVYINVCRDIGTDPSDSSTNGCPVGSGSCRKTGSTFTSLGEPKDGLKRSGDGHLTLTYTLKEVQNGTSCTSVPMTTIVFICPKRGGSRDPQITEDYDCKYMIEWETEYACPEATLTNDTCVLTKEDADIDIDLRPLTKLPGSDNPYTVTYKDSRDTTYKFYLNVCGELGIPCPDEGNKSRVPACQTKPSAAEFGRRMGSTDHTVLRYADGELTLTYKGGELCHHNNFQRETVIKFICNQTADNGGAGHPEFDLEKDCSYFFNWQTKYACVDHPLDGACRVNVDGKRYDLSSLVKTSGNWLALHETNSQFGAGNYFINVCHDVITEGAASGCEFGSAICYKDQLSHKSLGSYVQSPKFNKETNSIQITYTNGDLCANDKHISSTISFYCKPGDVESGPSLMHVSDDRCNYDFEWHTAAACVLGHYKGTDCKVYDSDAGFNFDLSRLTKQPGEEPYKVQSSQDTEHEYLLNVCAPLTGTKCNSLNIDNPGVCQVPKNNSDGAAYVGGQSTGELLYFDGMINLTYSGGTPYHDTASTPRKTEIAFLCDTDAGIGAPKFLSEIASDHYYGFEWRTAYACPTTPMECTAVDPNTNQEYDLSGLATSTINWAVDGAGNTKYYINVCRALNKVPVGHGCDAFASVCRTQFATNGTEQIDLPNLGQVKSDLQVEASGRLRLQYEGPKTCTNGSTKVPYVTNIRFICQKDAVAQGPSSPIQDGPCTYTILWNTVHACPLVDDTTVQSETCTVKDPNSDYVFNLKPLTRHADDAYTAQDGDVQYKLNICGDLPTTICDEVETGEHASVCQVNKDGSKTGLAMANYTLDFSETGRMSLTYDGLRLSNGERNNVQINFQCAPDVELGKPEFMRKEGSTYLFNFLTSLVCLPMATDCFVQDTNGDQYDLGSLGKNDGWTVLDPFDAKTRYYINVCRPVNNMGDSSCPDGPIGGCQVAANGHAYNIGYIQSKPIARNGTVTISYKNGDVCHKGTPNEEHRSTRIIFFCFDTEEGPVFEAESATCEYVFNWKTPAACKLQTSSGNDCKVVDPRYNYQFDLTPLRKTGSDYKVTKDDYDYYINVCGPLQETGRCDLTTGVGACQTKSLDASFSPVNAGKSNSNLQYASGELTLTYTGGKEKCHGQYERKTIIKFVCDQSKDGSQGPIFIEESFNCQYVFEWATSHACPPFKSGSCYLRNGDDTYDLSSLTLLNANYDFLDKMGQKRYVINVCRSLIHQKDATCPYNAAACMVDLTKPESDTERYENIGEVNEQQVQVVNNRLELVYNNGDVCKNGPERMTTRIQFFCDETAKLTGPTGHFMQGECEHFFLWSSSEACPLKRNSTQPPSATNSTSCVVNNPKTGSQFDLSRLTLKTPGGYKVTDSQGHQIEFNVCAPLVGSACQANSSTIGSCQSELAGQKRTYNAGNIVSGPWFDDGVVVINMTGGAPCHNNQYKRNTVVTFVCNNHNGLGRPVFIDETEDCTYYVSWHTNIVCEEEVKCSVDTDDFHTLDLSPLSSQTDSVIQSTKDGEVFYLSVCKPLVPTAGILCPAGAASCRLAPGDGVHHTSLGKPLGPPVFDEITRKVTLMYFNGSTCDVDPKLKYTTRIIFSCLPGPVKMAPVFLRKEGCEFLFKWDTSVICYDDTEPVAHSDKCGYSDPNTGDFLDLSKLLGYPKEVTDFNSKKYYIHMCGNLTSPTGCGDSMVCREDGVSFGHPRDYSIVKEEGVYKMTYALGSKCQDGSTAQSQILFRCNTQKEEGEPIYLTGIGCNVQFLWETSFVCPTIENPCRTIIEGQMYDLSPLTREAGAWKTTDSKGNIYWLNVCAPLTSPDTSCGHNMAACRKTANQVDQADPLGSVVNQKSLYRDESTKAIVLEYINGGSACSANKRRSNNQSARTRINFLCGNVFGGPVFVERSENEEQCLFEFNWNTKLACEVKTESVTVTNGIVKDLHTGGVFNFTTIFNKEYSYTQKRAQKADQVFNIMLNGTANDCGAICLVNGTNSVVLGTFKSAVYHVYDDNVKIQFKSPVKCQDAMSKFNISSDIEFVCSKKDEGPKLLYSSSNCYYDFTWKTPAACISPLVINPIPGGQGNNTGAGGTPSGTANQNTGGSKSVSSKTIGTIVGVFLTAIVLCILVVVFHREDRRVACLNVVKGLYGRRSGTDYAQLRYQRLPTDVTEDLTGANDIITITDAAETETTREQDALITVSTMPTSYHDDSDEDLLA